MTPVLITTNNRGVFFGYIANPGDDASPDFIKLTDARNAVFWSTDVHGYMSLAAVGPTDSCRVGPKVPTVTLYGVSSVSECTPEAAAAWELEPWAEE